MQGVMACGRSGIWALKNAGFVYEPESDRWVQSIGVLRGWQDARCLPRLPMDMRKTAADLQRWARKTFWLGEE